MDRRTKQKIACALLLAVGTGLIIAGGFMPALLIPGVPIFVGGLGVLASIVEDKDKIAFNTTINNINNYADGTQVRQTERVRARFNFGPSVANRIGEWNEKLRDLFANAPAEMNLTGNDAPVLTFTNNYHLGAETSSKTPKLLIEDVTGDTPKPEPLGPRLSAIDEELSEGRRSVRRASRESAADIEKLDLELIEQTYAPPKTMVAL